MKKVVLLLIVILTVAITALSIFKNRQNHIFEHDLEALSWCEVSFGGGVVYSCSGDDGTCTKTYKGVTLSCSGGRD